MSESNPFVPHAIIVPERSRPSPIFVVCITGVDRFLRVDFSQPHRPINFVREALVAVRGPLRASPFGLAVGFVINYREDYAVRFDLSGNPMSCHDHPWRTGQASMSLRGKDLSAVLKPR